MNAVQKGQEKQLKVAGLKVPSCPCLRGPREAMILVPARD